MCDALLKVRVKEKKEVRTQTTLCKGGVAGWNYCSLLQLGTTALHYTTEFRHHGGSRDIGEDSSSLEKIKPIEVAVEESADLKATLRHGPFCRRSRSKHCFRGFLVK